MRSEIDAKSMALAADFWACLIRRHRTDPSFQAVIEVLLPSSSGASTELGEDAMM